MPRPAKEGFLVRQADELGPDESDLYYDSLAEKTRKQKESHLRRWFGFVEEQLPGYTFFTMAHIEKFADKLISENKGRQVVHSYSETVVTYLSRPERKALDQYCFERNWKGLRSSITRKVPVEKDAGALPPLLGVSLPSSRPCSHHCSAA